MSYGYEVKTVPAVHMPVLESIQQSVKINATFKLFARNTAPEGNNSKQVAECFWSRNNRKQSY